MPDPGLVVAGFVVGRPVAPPPDVKDVLPDRILSISECLVDDVPRPEFWDWFTDRESALRAAESQGDRRHHVTTVALAGADAAAFMDQTGGADQPYFELLRRATPVPATSRVLGFEVVGAEEPLCFHSWHCHDYAVEVRDQLGIVCTTSGLLPTYAQAARVLAWMRGLPGSEAPTPVPWVVAAHVRDQALP